MSAEHLLGTGECLCVGHRCQEAAANPPHPHRGWPVPPMTWSCWARETKSCVGLTHSARVLPLAILMCPVVQLSKDGLHLVIELEDLGPHFEFLVAYWKKEAGAEVSLGA